MQDLGVLRAIVIQHPSCLLLMVGDQAVGLLADWAAKTSLPEG